MSAQINFLFISVLQHLNILVDAHKKKFSLLELKLNDKLYLISILDF